LGPYGTITDSLSPRLVALLVGSALLHRQKTGRGQYIDLSQVEGGVTCLSENILTYTATGERLSRIGNASRHAAPHGAFRCAPKGEDDDRWLAIAIHDDEDWRRLQCVVGAAWVADKRFENSAGRLQHAEEIESALAAWTRSQGAEDLMERLQGAGIDAAVVQNFEDLLNDPQLRHRKHFHSLDHPVIGEHLCETNAMRFSATTESVRRPAPRLGEHTEMIMRELVGMDAGEYETLRRDGLFE
jgi:crotonobetainyl-CoA:carnitine CoA-transferase CaiB-like acyl-CoA transferase